MKPHLPKPSAAFGLNLDAWGRLVLIDSEGTRHVGVEPVRAFPLSDPGHWISLCDAHGREIVCVENPSTLPETTRRLLEEELERRQFVPVIQRIVRTTSDPLPADWDVVTDRGRTRVTIKSLDDLRRLGPDRVLLTDARGLRFQIAGISALDATSRRILERHL